MKFMGMAAMIVLIVFAIIGAWSIGHASDVARAQREGRVCGPYFC